ncbi:MAG: hypothetical protein Q4C30_07370 [Bacteroidia bacterium]|nr:hypothetical protein [Bacteroidia bacterium]
MAIFDMYAQQPIDLGARAIYTVNVSPRWTLSADGSIYQQLNHQSGTWWRLSTKGQFKVMERRLLFASASITHQEYNSITNSDTELRLVEGIAFLTQTNFSHSFYLSQRRIIYKPSDDKAFCSDATYYQQYSFKNISPKYTPYLVASETINITPDISNAPIFQRFRIGGGISITTSNKIKLAINYTYSLGSKRQIFIGDANKLSMLTLVFNYNHL